MSVGAKPAVFTARGTIDGASIWRGDKFIMSDLEADAAKRLATLLNEADDLASLMSNRGGIEHARLKIAFAVAEAMRRKIDFTDHVPTGRALL